MTVQEQLQTAMRHYQSGRRAEAEQICRGILAHHPNHDPTLNLLSAIYSDAGRLDEAITLIGRAIAINPGNAAYHANLGEFHRRRGQLAESISSLRRAIQINPGMANAYRSLGAALDDAGSFAEAIRVHRTAIALQPSAAGGYYNLGNSLMKGGDAAAAVEAFGQAVRLNPQLAEAYYNAGAAYVQLGRFDQAIDVYSRVLSIKPDFGDARHRLANAYNKLGLARERSGNIAAAIDAYGRASQTWPENAQAVGNLANALAHAGRMDEALAAFDKAIELNPNFADAYSNLGVALTNFGWLDQAIEMCRKAIAVNPTYAPAYVNLGNTLQRKGELDEAEAALAKATELDAHLAEAYNNLGNIRKDQGRIAEALASFGRAMELAPDQPIWHSNRLLALNYLPDQNPREIFQEHRQWAARHAATIPFQTHQRRRAERLRIGYVSADLCHHSVAAFLMPLLQWHDHKKFHVTCYSNGAREDNVTDQIRAKCDGWANLRADSDEQAAAKISEDGIDILVDLGGHTAGNRLPLFARKPAPVQVTYLGYPNTTGMETIDWRITDEKADPAGAEAFYSEQLMRLARTAWCFHSISSDPPIGKARRSEVVFGSFNDCAKINTPLLRLWAEILKRVDNSRLMLKTRSDGLASVTRRFRGELEEFGIARDRVELLPARPAHVDHLRCYDQMDIALDTFPYHGTTTTCEAMWMGVPVVSRAGDAHVSRVGVSLLGSVGLQDLLATDADDYVRIAVKLAEDRDRVAELRSTLRQRMTASPLMDGKGFVRDVEVAYRQMWQSWVER